jgi:hypothetical protein
MVMGWDQLVFNAFPDRVVFQELGTLIVEAVELGLAASFGEGGMDLSYCCCERLCLSIAQWSHEDAVAVIVIGYQDVVVAVAGRLGQSSSLVSIDTFLGFGDRKEACVGSSGILWLGRKVVGICGWQWLFLRGLLGVLLVFFLMLSRCPIAVASDLGGFFRKDLGVTPGNGGMKPFTSAVSIVESEGIPMAPWAKAIKLA